MNDIFTKRMIKKPIIPKHRNRFIPVFFIIILLICINIHSEPSMQNDISKKNLPGENKAIDSPDSIYPEKIITGTFYQPSNSCPLIKDPAKWEPLFREMKDLNMDTIIIQWIIRDESAFYETELPWIKHKNIDILRIILEQAKKWKFKVIIGLYFSNEWWKQEKGHLTTDVFIKNCEIIREIKAKYLPHPCFSGWYLPQEISNYTTSLPHLKDEIRTFLKQMSRIRDEETSGATISLAPFFNAQKDKFSSPKEYGEWWKYVAKGTGLNIIMLQDGMGAHPATWEKMTEFFLVLKNSLQDSGIEIWSDLEIFQKRMEGEKSILKPASFESVKKQMILESPLVDKIVCFAYPNYAFSLMGTEQKILHESYKKYIESIMNIRKESKQEEKGNRNGK